MSYQGIKKILSVLLSLSLVSMGQPAQSQTTYIKKFFNSYGTTIVHHHMRTTFSANDVKLKDNQWVAHLIGQEENKVGKFSEAVKTDMTSLEILEKSSGTERDQEWVCRIENENDPRAAELLEDMMDTEYQRLGKEEPSGNCDSLKRVNLNYQLMRIGQDLVNLGVKFGPQLKQMLDEDRFDEAFKFASDQYLLRYVIQSAGIQILGSKPFDQSRMLKFYEAAHKNWSIINVEGQPYTPMRWGDSRGWRNAAAKNSAHKDMGEWPNLAFFISRDPEVSTGQQWLGVITAVVLSVVTAGIGSAISGAVVSTFGSGVTVAANGAITAGTIGGVSIAAGTVGGTVLAVGSSAIAGAIVGTVQGQNFGDALVSGIVGGAAGAVVGNVASNVGVGDAVNAAIPNDIVASYVTGVTIGTATGALLNGGDLDAAFTGAASGTATSMIANGFINNANNNSGLSQEEMRAHLDALAQGTHSQIQNDTGQIIDNRLSNLSDAITNQMAIQAQNTISNHANTAMGGLDFSNTIQNQNLYNQLGNAQAANDFNNNLMDRANDYQNQFDSSIDGYEPLDSTPITVGGNAVPGSTGLALLDGVTSDGNGGFIVTSRGVRELFGGNIPDSSFYRITNGADGRIRLFNIDGSEIPLSQLQTERYYHAVGVYGDTPADDFIALANDGFNRNGGHSQLSDRIGNGAVNEMSDVGNGGVIFHEDGTVSVGGRFHSTDHDLSSQNLANTLDNLGYEPAEVTSGRIRVDDIAPGSYVRTAGGFLVRSATGVLTVIDAGGLIRDLGDFANEALPGARADYADAIDAWIESDDYRPWLIEDMETAGNTVAALAFFDWLGNTSAAEGLGNVSDTINDAIGDAANSVIDSYVDSVTTQIENGFYVDPYSGMLIQLPQTPSTDSNTASTTESVTGNTSVVTSYEPVSISVPVESVIQTVDPNIDSGYNPVANTPKPMVATIPVIQTPPTVIQPTTNTTRRPANYGGGDTRRSTDHRLSN